jgi:uncharacterized protein
VTAQRVWKRRVAKYARWLHIYVSMASLLIVLFFAVTGITLNHADWFARGDSTTEVAGYVDPQWTDTAPKDVDRNEIVTFLRHTHGLSGALSDVRVDTDQCEIAFKGPGYAADILIDRKSGKYVLTESRLGIVAVLNDLHKGRDTGGTWRAVVDGAAGLLVLIALTGLTLIYFVHKHRSAGVALLLGGGALAWLIYRIWVP